MRTLMTDRPVRMNPPDGEFTIALVKSNAVFRRHHHIVLTYIAHTAIALDTNPDTTLTAAMAQARNLVSSAPVHDSFREVRDTRTERMKILAIDHIEPMDLETARLFYAEHEGRDHFGRLIRSVTGLSGVVAIVLAGEDIVSRWRTMMGVTDPDDARRRTPNSLRALLGTRLPHNAVHGSDSPEAARREFDILWPATA